MSKKTDYKKLWREEQKKYIALNNEVQNNLIPRLLRAEKVLIGIVYDEVDVEEMKKHYFENNPNAPKKEDGPAPKDVVPTKVITKKGLEDVKSTNIEPKPAK